MSTVSLALAVAPAMAANGALVNDDAPTSGFKNSVYCRVKMSQIEIQSANQSIRIPEWNILFDCKLFYYDKYLIVV